MKLTPANIFCTNLAIESVRISSALIHKNSVACVYIYFSVISGAAAAVLASSVCVFATVGDVIVGDNASTDCRTNSVLG